MISTLIDPSADFVYFIAVLVLLVALRSPWPWKKAGGAVFAILVLTATAVWMVGHGERLAESLPAMCLLLSTLSVCWWRLHAAFEQRPGPDSGATAGAWRWSAAGAVVIAIGMLAIGFAELKATELPWFLLGLEALEPRLGHTYAWWIVPLAAVAALVMAPHLDAHDGESPSAFDGRRDEVPFFFFIALTVGVLPIALASLAPDFLHTNALLPLSERVWLDLLARPLPEALMLRELPGLLLYLSIFVLLPWQLPRWQATRGVFDRHRKRLGTWRYSVTMTLAGLLLLVPVRMVLGWWLEIGPWIYLPGWGLAL